MEGEIAGAEVVKPRPVELAVAADECCALVDFSVQGAAACEVALGGWIGLLRGFEAECILDGVPQGVRLFENEAHIHASVGVDESQHVGDGYVAAEAAPAVAEARQAVAVERDAQVEAARASGDLPLDRLALASREREQQPAPPVGGAQVAHGVVRADDCFIGLFHILFFF